MWGTPQRSRRISTGFRRPATVTFSARRTGAIRIALNRNPTAARILLVGFGRAGRRRFGRRLRFAGTLGFSRRVGFTGGIGFARRLGLRRGLGRFGLIAL